MKQKISFAENFKQKETKQILFPQVLIFPGPHLWGQLLVGYQNMFKNEPECRNTISCVEILYQIIHRFISYSPLYVSLDEMALWQSTSPEFSYF